MNVQDNSKFFYAPTKFGKWKYTKKNDNEIKTIYDTRKFDKQTGFLIEKGEVLNQYKNMYQYIIHDITTENCIFNKKFDKKIHSLSIMISNLKSIKLLPKELLVLNIVTTKSSNFTIPVHILPKNLMSIYIQGEFPFNGTDLTKLKNLQSIYISQGCVSCIPKLPKSIEYITFYMSGLGNGNVKEKLKNFDIKKFPNLKLLDVRYSAFTKKNVPVEWTELKKSKKINIYW